MKFTHTFDDIISIENLLEAWKEFLRGKRQRRDVQEFQLRLMQNILNLHTDLRNKTYRHGPYQHFKVADPKPRDIHKATVLDRLFHHAIYRKLYPFFDDTFIADSFSCRDEKGTHRALNKFRSFSSWVGDGHRRPCFILKCDIRKFFANIDHAILMNILVHSIPDHDILWLLREIVESFNSGKAGIGLPLGNLTSQLFVNIYMNEFDQFVKHELKVKYYIRYADDFLVLSDNESYLQAFLPRISQFLFERLQLELHPDKVFIKTLTSGVDFLGWVHFPDHRVLRTTTKRRMFTRVNEHNLASYVGLCKHGNTYRVKVELLSRIENIKTNVK